MRWIKRAGKALTFLLCFSLLAPAFAGIALLDAQAGEETSYFQAFSKGAYEEASTTFSLKVNGKTVDTVKYFPEDADGRYSYAHLGFEGTATFAITGLKGKITDCDISPHSYGIDYQIEGEVITFSLTQSTSRYLVVRATMGGVEYQLFIAADPDLKYKEKYLDSAERVVDAVQDLGLDNTGSTTLSRSYAYKDVAEDNPLQAAINDLSKAGGGVLYFPAGTYKFVNIYARDNVTLYLDDGAFLRGSGKRTDYEWSTTGANGIQAVKRVVDLNNASNFAIVGHGMVDANAIALSASGKTSSGSRELNDYDYIADGYWPDGWNDYRTGIVDADGANGITFDGVTFKDATGWTFNICNSGNIQITNVKMLDDYEVVHSDGYDLCACQNVHISDCLGVCGDDVYCPKGSTSGRDMAHYLIENSVAYADGGSGCKIGVQARSDTYDIVFRDIDVIQGYRGFCVAHDEGTGTWHDITFENIRTERLVYANGVPGGGGQYNSWAFSIWTLSSGGTVSDVDVINCSFEDTCGLKGMIKGASSSAQVSGVRFENLKMDGQTINTDNYLSKLMIGDNVTTSTVTFKNAALQLTDTVRYEAETYPNTLAGGASYSTANACSSGLLVGSLGADNTNGGSVSINVYAETAGERDIDIYYCTNGARSFRVTANGTSQVISCPSSGSFTAPASTPVTVTLALEAGMNTITFDGSGTGWAPNLDRIEVYMLSNAERAAVASLVEEIDALSSGDTTAVELAVGHYNAMTNSQKAFVSNIEALQAAAQVAGDAVSAIEPVNPGDGAIGESKERTLMAVDGVLAGQAAIGGGRADYVTNLGYYSGGPVGDSEGTVTFTVNPEEDTAYRMTIYYLSKNAVNLGSGYYGEDGLQYRDLVVTVNGVPTTLPCPAGSSWNDSSLATSIVLPGTVFLYAGANTISFGNPYDKDAPSLYKVVLTPTIVDSSDWPSLDGTRYEAEEAGLNDVTGLAENIRKDEGTGVTSIWGLDYGNGTITFRVNAEDAGTRRLGIACVCYDARDVRVLVNGEEAGMVTCVSTGSWGTGGTTYSEEVYLPVYLVAGENTLVITGKADAYGPGVDYIFVADVSEANAAAAVTAVVEAIEALPSAAKLTLADAADVAAAEALYNGLSENQKEKVTNADALEQAVTTISTLKNRVDEEAAAAVIKQIAALGEITSLDQEALVELVRAAYDALSRAQQKLVSNYVTLLAAEEAILELREAAAVVPGDVDGDGFVTVSDVVALRQRIIAGTWSDAEYAAGNLDDSDELLSVSDVVALRQRIVAGS